MYICIYIHTHNHAALMTLEKVPKSNPRLKKRLMSPLAYIITCMVQMAAAAQIAESESERGSMRERETLTLKKRER